jgi:quercetin dioxygenase-like cupin family protein
MTDIEPAATLAAPRQRRMTRRLFATCVVCAGAGFAATPAAAQGAPPSGGLSRKVLSQTDGPAPGYVTIIAEVEISPGAVVAPHTHPGIETGYVLEGEVELPIQGVGTRNLKPGDAFQVPPGTVHGGGKASAGKVRIVSTFVVEKAKPLASPA